jgi:hypothetical protein
VIGDAGGSVGASAAPELAGGPTNSHHGRGCQPERTERNFRGSIDMDDEMSKWPLIVLVAFILDEAAQFGKFSQPGYMCKSMP